MYRNVIVGTDGSETAERAVRHAAGLVVATGARLVIVTAFAPATHADDPEESRVPDDLRWLLTDRSQADAKAQHGRELAREEGASRVVVQTIEGDPTDALLEAARDFDADLIVVGSKGLTSSAHFILGSVASNVSHHAPCDVLVVHTT